jgi:hypothetical protein
MGNDGAGNDRTNNDRAKDAWSKNDRAKNDRIRYDGKRKTTSPTVTIRVAGSLSQGHLTYLDQLVASAIDCALWPMLDLSCLDEIDRVALMYLLGGEGRDFGIVGCPNFVRDWMLCEKSYRAA